MESQDRWAGLADVDACAQPFPFTPLVGYPGFVLLFCWDAES